MSNDLKLLTEITMPDEVMTESTDKGFYIKGPFISYQRNRNNRIYLREGVLNEVARYKADMIDTGRAFGELEHPSTTKVNPDRVSHLITDLQEFQGEYVMGKAKIIESTPCGKIAKALAQEGSIGISTRSVGKLSSDGTVPAFRLITADIVLNPSGIECFVDMIQESYEYLAEEGVVRPMAKKKLDSLDIKGFREVVMKEFNSFFIGINSK